ncbi:hypothetical protein CHLNCDRAFT_138062 [Chlorella variabilis]|uniref:Uncharacterized protein n=1 Tax=Chlorella variabilis TaxID=554065 RepID=E1Z561_CHLVA|nr:hypothetical protein CHLNCDRAFT_138062 [Chlorella variabilis]EFN59469.1 hypothetical protein CHLNCDRAFT_138062 [Chlorella variabilis]|eukprot:XP_005851571.1 hypothetical protein CHLNCDRAFT_138062 [Chlorella variabilis]
MALSERGDDDDALERPAFEQQAVALAAQLPQGGGGDGSRQPQAAAVAPTAAESGGDGSPKADVDSSNGLHRNISTKESLEPKLSTASSEHGSEASSGMSPPHYNAGDDIILRLEFLRTNEMKTIIRSVWAAVVVGTIILIIALYVKIDKPDSHYLEDNAVPIINLCFGGVLLPALLACWLMFFYRVYRSNLSKKRWSHRRKRAATLGGIEITLQLINCVFFIIPNAYVLGHLCSWFHPLVLWSGKYVGRADGAVMDAPLRAHWPKLSLWVVEEGTLLALTITMWLDPEETVWDPTITDCRQQNWNCHFTPAGSALLAVNVTCIVIYFLLWIFFVARALNNLKHLPYNGMRMANLTTRLQIKLRGLSITFFVLCSITYTFVKLNTCSSYIISWLGFLPMQVVMTATAIANAYMTMPKRPHQTGILQVWLQEFAWLERDIPRKKEERASSLPPDSYENFCLECEPLWCFEARPSC